MSQRAARRSQNPSRARVSDQSADLKYLRMRRMLDARTESASALSSQSASLKTQKCDPLREKFSLPADL
jgi:hypothetical protein